MRDVRDVRAVGDGFEVTVRDCQIDREKTEFFDHVVVASGHFSVPNVLHYDGFEQYNGRIQHAHDFR